MPVRVGNTNTSLRVGSTAIRSAFVGTTRVFSSTGTTSPPPGPPTPPQPPPAPDVAPTPYDLSAVRGDGAFTLSWKSALFGSPAFKVQISTDAIAWLDLPTSTITISTINIETATILTAGATVTASPGTYYVRVAGVIGTSRGQYSPATSVTILAASTDPTGLTVTAESDYYLLVTWDSGTTQVVSGTDNPPIDFHLERSKDDGATWEQAAGWRFNASRPPGARIDSWNGVDAPATPSLVSLGTDANYLLVGGAGSTTQNFSAGYNVAGTPGTSYKFRLRRRRVKTALSPGLPEEPQPFSAWSATSAAVTMPAGPLPVTAPTPANLVAEIRDGWVYLQWDGGGNSDWLYKEAYVIEWRKVGDTFTPHASLRHDRDPASSFRNQYRVPIGGHFPTSRHGAVAPTSVPVFPGFSVPTSKDALEFRLLRARFTRNGAGITQYATSAWSSSVGPSVYLPPPMPQEVEVHPANGGLYVDFNSLAQGAVLTADSYDAATSFLITATPAGGGAPVTLTETASNLSTLMFFRDDSGAPNSYDPSGSPRISGSANGDRARRRRVLVTGLTNGVQYSVTVAPQNAAGTTYATTPVTGVPSASAIAPIPVGGVSMAQSSTATCKRDCWTPTQPVATLLWSWSRLATWPSGVSFDVEKGITNWSLPNPFNFPSRVSGYSLPYTTASQQGCITPASGLSVGSTTVTYRHYGGVVVVDPTVQLVVGGPNRSLDESYTHWRVRPRSGANVGPWTYMGSGAVDCVY